MDARVFVLALAALLTTGCDTSKRETRIEGESNPPLSADTAMTAGAKRSGTIQIGEKRYQFNIGLCSIQQPTNMKRFMVSGSGTTEDGRQFTVNADGGTDIAAVMLRITTGYNNPAITYSARIEPSSIRIQGNTISAVGEFSWLDQPRQPGQFNARCGKQAAPPDETAV